MKQQFLIKKGKAEEATAPRRGFSETSVSDNLQDRNTQSASALYEKEDGSDCQKFGRWL